MPLAVIASVSVLYRALVWNIPTHTARPVSMLAVKLYINLVTTLAESRPSDLHRMIP